MTLLKEMAFYALVWLLGLAGLGLAGWGAWEFSCVLGRTCRKMKVHDDTIRAQRQAHAALTATLTLEGGVQ